MALTLKELRESGLLELYVLEELGVADKRIVEDGLNQYSELKNDIREIEKALHYYAMAHSIPAPKGGLEKLMDTVNKGQNKQTRDSNSNKSGRNNWLKWILGLAVIALIGWNINQKNNYDQLSSDYDLFKQECDSLGLIRSQERKLYADLSDPGNSIIPIAATDKYKETNLVLYTNATNKKNIIQVLNLPDITSNQSYQLWSIKGTNPPAPLNVFRDDNRLTFEVDHIDETDAYAITIEPLGGSQSPTMDNLIGVFAL